MAEKNEVRETAYSSDHELSSDFVEGPEWKGNYAFKKVVKVTKIPDGAVEETLINYFENMQRNGGGPIASIEYHPATSSAIIEFEEADAVDRVLKKRPLLFLKRQISVEEYVEAEEEETSCRTIEVCGFAENTLEDVLEMYFENSKRSGGSEVTSVVIEGGVALVTFTDDNVASSVCEREHILGGRKLCLSLHLPKKKSSAVDTGREDEAAGKAVVETVKAKTDEQLDEDVRMETENIKEDPTVKPADNFNAEQDAETLWKAMKGWDPDKQAIINVLAYKSNAQRLEIVKTYKTMIGKDLIKKLDGELSGGFKKIARGLCMSPADFDAMSINKAIRGLGTDEKVLIEIICTRTNQQINDFMAAYKRLYGKDLKADVAGNTSGDFKQLLVSLLQANRDESKEFDRNKAKQDAQALLDADEKKWGTNESNFNVILVSRSYAQLRATFQEYAKLANKDIDDTIQSEMSDDLKDCILAIVRCIRCKASHFATELYRSMKGLGIDDDTICRVIVSRCEVDMVQIKDEFQQNYKHTLGMFIAVNTSGNYRKILFALIQEEGTNKKK